MNITLSIKRLMRPSMISRLPAAIFNSSRFRRLQQCVMYSTTVAETTWLESLGFPGRLKYSKQLLNNSALHIYLCCAELPDYDSMMHELSLSDTFNSFFRLLQLHVWMTMVRLQREGRDGKFVRNNVLNFMWQDMDKKSKKLGQMASSTARKEGLQAIAEQFKASLFAYDEGLMDDDRVLAGALWRNLFDKNCADAGHVELMVEYVRRQIVHVDKVDADPLLKTGMLKFLPLHETPDAFERQKVILKEIAKRVS